jgi:hypothetical protein
MALLIIVFFSAKSGPGIDRGFFAFSRSTPGGRT